MRIESIGENEHFECKGNVFIAGNIGKNATVIVKDGSLSVDGHIGESVDITLQSVSSSVVVSSGSFFVSGGSISIGGGQGDVRVQGNIGNNAKIKSQSASITIGGDIGSNVSIDTKSGDIRAVNIGAGSTLKNNEW